MTSIRAEGVECALIGAMGRGWQSCRRQSPDRRRRRRRGSAVPVSPKIGAAEGRPFEVVLGAQTESMLVTRADYADLLGRDPILATDDGSVGYAGFCTEPVREQLATGEYEPCIAAAPSR